MNFYIMPVILLLQFVILLCHPYISDRSYSDKVVANLLQRLEQKVENTRMGSLHIIRHLVNSGGPQMEAKKALIISGLRILIQEPSLKVRGDYCMYVLCKILIDRFW